MTKFITILTSENSDITTKSAFPSFKNKEQMVNSEELSENLGEFLTNIEPVINKKTEIGNFIIDEIELNLSISASGGIQLIGKLDIGVEGGIKLKLKRKNK